MSDNSSTIRVLIVDDQHMVRSGFSMMLSVEDDVDVVGEAPNGQVALDVQMPVMDGIEATRAIVAEDLAKVLILTTFDRDDYVFDGLQAGASGFLLKNAGPEQLVDALRAVAEGHALLAPEVTRRVIAAMSDSTPRAATGRTTGEQEALARLTDREREVLTLVARGLSNSEIAKELFLGEATVKTHVSNTLAKLHLRDRVQAVVFAYENGLTPS
jgi:DNA-binding NarL/FixJ family response regulator